MFCWRHAPLPTHPAASLCAPVGPLEVSLGVLLVDFLRLYGRSLNTERAGVSCRDGGSFFSKQAARMLQADRPYMMSVEDPGDDTNDLCKGSWNIAKVGWALWEHGSGPCWLKGIVWGSMGL